MVRLSRVALRPGGLPWTAVASGLTVEGGPPERTRVVTAGR
jgi:hypothetical protein